MMQRIQQHLFLVQVQLRSEPRAGEHLRRAGAGHVPRLLHRGLGVPHHLIQDHLHVMAAVGNLRRSVGHCLLSPFQVSNWILQACRCPGCWPSPP